MFSPAVLLHSSQRCGGGRDDSLKEHPPLVFLLATIYYSETQRTKDTVFFQKPTRPGGTQHFTYTLADSAF